jgi:hypothetical protein
MSLTTVEISDETRNRKLVCGITYEKLIKLGLDFVENRKTMNEEVTVLEENIKKMQQMLVQQSRRILLLESERNNNLDDFKETKGFGVKKR